MKHRDDKPESSAVLNEENATYKRMKGMRAWILISSALTRHIIPLNHYDVQNCIIKSTGKHKVRGTKLKKSSVTY